MAYLESYGTEINSIFQLLGYKENDITLSMSWALSQCKEFTKLVLIEIFGIEFDSFDEVIVKYQNYDNTSGITDIELKDNKKFHVIFEAKRGWVTPQALQLSKYSLREDFQRSNVKNKAIVSLSECSQEYAYLKLPFHKANGIPIHEVNGIPIKHLSWKDINKLSIQAKLGSNHRDKHLLDEFQEYLKGVMTMQKKESNWVYVVSLGSSKPAGCDLTWIDIVKVNNKYFHPAGGNGWPKEPPNYIAFRYHGQLQAIHHIENYVISENLHQLIPEMPDVELDDNHFVYNLGPAIIPVKKIKSGNIYRNGRVWAMLDTLLTCDTITEARDKSYARVK